MIIVNGTNITIPNLTHASAELNERNRVILQMDAGYVFWDKKDYIDADGNMYDPAPEDIAYSRWASLSPTRDFSLLMEAAESEVPADQIHSNPTTPPTETV